MRRARTVVCLASRSTPTAMWRAAGAYHTGGWSFGALERLKWLQQESRFGNGEVGKETADALGFISPGVARRLCTTQSHRIFPPSQPERANGAGPPGRDAAPSRRRHCCRASAATRPAGRSLRSPADGRLFSSPVSTAVSFPPPLPAPPHLPRRLTAFSSPRTCSGQIWC